MTTRARVSTACLAALLAAGCISNVPRYTVTPARDQTPQQMDNDKFDCNLQAQNQTGYNPDQSLTNGALAFFFRVAFETALIHNFKRRQ